MQKSSILPDIKDFIIKSVNIVPGGARHLGCLYCGESLEGAKKEHIFNASWGGREASSALVCSACNEYFSNEIDWAFKDWVRHIRNAWGIKTQRSPQIPIIKAENDLIIGQYGRPELETQTSIHAELIEDDAVRVEVSGWKTKRDRMVLLTNYAEIERQIGKPLTERQKRELASGKMIEWIPRHTKFAELKTSILSYPEKEYRLAANVLLKCLGHYMPEEIRKEGFAQLRKFVREGDENYQRFAVVTEEHQDISPVSKPMMMSQFNCAEIHFRKKERKIIGVVNVMGHIKRSIIMADNVTLEQDCVLWVAERFDDVKKFAAGYIKLSDHFLCPPSILIYGPPTEEYTTKEVLGLRKFLTWTAGPFGEFKSEITRLDKKYNLINDNAIVKINKAIVTLIEYLLRVRRKTKPIEQIVAVMNDCGLNGFNKDIVGKKLIDDEVQNSFSQFLWKVYIAHGIEF